MDDIETWRALLAEAVSVVDSLDNIDDMAALGEPMDDLAYLTAEIGAVDAVTAVLDGGDIDTEMVANAWRSVAPHQWRVAWLIARTNCSHTVAESTALLNVDDWLRIAREPDRDSLRTALRDAATAAADDLCAELAVHPNRVAVPDTIPDDWVA